MTYVYKVKGKKKKKTKKWHRSDLLGPYQYLKVQW